MTILVAYASKYGSTRAIAERIAETLTSSGLDAVAQSVTTRVDVSRYDAFVLGSALYMGAWMKEAVAFAQRHRDVLASRPVWLFSSGPLGTASTDAQGRDIRSTAGPKNLPELRESLAARDHRVFFGMSDHTRFDLRDRLIYALPAGKELLVDGDFREWVEVEAWAREIGNVLASLSVPLASR